MSAKTSKLYNLVSAIGAFVVWGAWAYYINRDVDTSVRLVSATTQGTASLIITLAIVRLVSSIFNRLPRKLFSILIAAVCSVLCTGSCLVAIHMIVGTPEILGTVSPPLTVAFLFCLFTAYKLYSDTKND